jgi:lysophospholipase L1-like esterase
MSRFAFLLTTLAAPIYAWYGAGVRLRTGRMMPPTGPHFGFIEGVEPPLRVLLIGDSSIAAVGAETAVEGLAARFAHHLASATGQAVQWRGAGFNSATTRQLRDIAVPNIAAEPVDLVVVVAGINDLKNYHGLGAFKKSFGGLLYAIRAKFPAAQIFWSQIVEPKKVPALPQRMAAILSVRAAAFNALGAQLCKERFANAVPAVPIQDASGFAADGFHAGPAGYDVWAKHLCDHVVPQLERDTQPE